MILNRRNIVLSSMVALLLAPSLSPAAKGGKGKGGGDLTTGCLTYLNRARDEIQSDGFVPNEYCHGTDGQITVPTLLRHDLKKFNGNGRTIIVDPFCHDGGVRCFGSPAEAIILQSTGEGLSDGIYKGNNLKFQEMAVSQVTRVSLDFDLSRQLHVYFGNGSFVNDATQTCGLDDNSKSGPAWVRCEVHDGAGCTEWTVSSDDLRSGPDTVNPTWPDDARACLVKYKGGTQVLDGDVEADFKFYLISQQP